MSRITLALLILIALSGFMNAEDIAWQGFEGSPDDSWAYQTNSVTSGYWGLMDDEFGGALPQSGSQYWASWNMGGNEGIISFANQNLPLGYVYTLSFYYYTRLLSSPTEYSRYCLSYDNGVTWQDWITLLPNTQAWTQVSIEIPVQYRQLLLKVAAKHSGTSKYAHWDSFLLSRVPAPPQAPVIYNLQIAQRTDGSGLVDIHYDLFDVNNDPADISLLLSSSAGSSFDITPGPAFLSGDIGPNIPLGTGKHIVWDAGAQGIALESDQYKFRLLAEDGTTYGTVATPVFDPPGGTYNSPQLVSITSATDGATIHYTIDGSEPTEASSIYTAPISVIENKTLKAKAYKSQWINSETAQEDFEIFIAPEGFVYVPGGTYIMGDTRGTGNSDELPTHSVALNPFYMGKYEVTQGEWQTVMGSNPASGYGEGANYPIYNVSWYAVLKYCNLRSINEGLTPAYYISGSTNPSNWGAVPTSDNTTWNAAICNWSANGYRLPTEAEWEYTARGVTNTPDYLYSGSEDVNYVAWYSGNNSPHSTKPVGSKAPNGIGTYDMSGNVWEWCWDWYSNTYYSSSPDIEPTGPANGSERLLRGGVFWLGATDCRVARRNHCAPSFLNGSMGFRCVKNIVLPQVESPVFDPPGGTYYTAQTVSITCATDGAAIYYTTDGSEPTETSSLYTMPITITENTTIKAKAFITGWIASEISEAEYVINLMPATFVLIEGGTFNNGTSDVTISSFYIDKYELTQASYQAVMGTNPSYFAGNPNRPVEQVFWFNAIEYCNRRSIQEGLAPCYSYSTYGTNPSNWPTGWNTSDANHTNVSCSWSANGYRLPTEMEWMFAAKGGNQSQEFIYSGSNTIGNVAWYMSNSGSRTHDVGELDENEVGIYDMSGNVWEWCWDIFASSYPSGLQNNPTGASNGSSRVMRGGSWINYPDACTVSHRGGFVATHIYSLFGFRILRRAP